MTPDFQLDDDLPLNGTLIQASAGTGKTYSVAALVTQAIAEKPGIRMGNVLVTTYTRNAAAELRDRIRGRMQATAMTLRGTPPAGYAPDKLDARLLADEATRAAKAARLERAVAEFDTATIGTIHSICAVILRMTGMAASETGNEDTRRDVITEVVNDAVVAETLAARDPGAGEGPEPDVPPRPEWDEQSLRGLVKKSLGDPHVVSWYPPAQRPEVQAIALDAARRVVGECVARVRQRMAAAPGFDDLLLLARDAVAGEDPRATSFRESLRKKYKLAIVDEAQDTNRLQWEFLHAIFPPDTARPESDRAAGSRESDGTAEEPRRLLAVGDPKQAIYGFRGADVTAYLRFAQSGTIDSRESRRRTLRVNRRSDGLLLAGLNTVMDGASFGVGIPYEHVRSAEDRKGSRMKGLTPVEFIDVGEVSLERVAVAKVYELLTRPVFEEGSGAVQPFKPQDICVLCRTNDVGAAVARQLAWLDIPVVTAGTASVMAGQVAADLRVLLEAMERPSDVGRARLAAATGFFGRNLTALTHLGDEELKSIQDVIGGWHAALRTKGIAAMAGAIMAGDEVAKRLAVGREGQRRIVDFAHIVELLNEDTGGRGTSARVLLECLATLANMDATDDLVSRRVEGDDESVRVMTVHKAKGLQFPAVVVVDDWKPKEAARHRGPAVFYADDERRMDVGVALTGIGTADESKVSAVAGENDDRRRVLYVAVTRPKYHVSILRTVAWQQSLLREVMKNAPATTDEIADEHRESISVRQAAELPEAKTWKNPEAETELDFTVAALPPKVEQTYRRNSFSTIKRAAGEEPADHHAPETHGHDEAGAAAAGTAAGEPEAELDTDGSAPPDVVAATGLDAFTMSDLPGGEAFGSIVHDVLEHLDFGPGMSEEQLRANVLELVARFATSATLRPRHDAITTLVCDALMTPFGGPADAPFRDLRFVDFAAQDRLVELDFEMGVVDIASGVLASDVGRVLKHEEFLPPQGLRAYVESLASPAFNVPLAGLINGQIDALLRIPGRPEKDPLLVIADYKTNTLHRAGDTRPLAAYAPHRLCAAMAHADYPLQALLYGTSAWRMLRARLGAHKPPGWDPGDHIAGIVYAFLRGMKGKDTPVDAAGHRYGVFVWQPPSKLWRRLSDLLAGDLTGLRS